MNFKYEDFSRVEKEKAVKKNYSTFMLFTTSPFKHPLKKTATVQRLKKKRMRVPREIDRIGLPFLFSIARTLHVMKGKDQNS